MWSNFTHSVQTRMKCFQILFKLKHFICKLSEVYLSTTIFIIYINPRTQKVVFLPKLTVMQLLIYQIGLTIKFMLLPIKTRFYLMNIVFLCQ